MWADARIDGKTVVVSSDKVVKPIAVRYCWATNPSGKPSEQRRIVDSELQNG